MDIFPNFEHDTSQVNLRNIMMESINQNIEPIGYEDSLLHDMADDISKRLEPQISVATSIAEASKSIAESAKQDVTIQKELLDTYKKELASAKKSSILSGVISVISISITIATLVLSIIGII